ncbi:MAG: hypothetical protein WA399_18860 [Acidobacteriaceae bacterium]
MKKAKRFLLLCGVLALTAAPIFADGGPGGTDPPPPNQSTTGTNSSTTAGVVAALLAYLGL